MEAKVRKIIHVDMDAFYASVEQRDHPEWRGKPVLVGGSPTGRGVVAAASYEARRFGVRSAMSAAKAKRLCPQAIFVRSHFDRYREVSQQIHKIFREVSDQIEPLSLDEAFLDVTENKLNEPLARRVAVYLRARIKGQTGLTASAGVAPNKFLAKIASDIDKPNGLVVIAPSQVDAFLESLPVERLWGVGPATTRRLHRLGFRSVKDLRGISRELCQHRLGKHGAFLWDLAHGKDNRPVNPTRERKSRGMERTFFEDIRDLNALKKVLKKQAEEIAEALQKKNHKGRTITLKIRYHTFETFTRSHTVPKPTNTADVFFEIGCALLEKQWKKRAGAIRLLGISISQFQEIPIDPQLSWSL